MWIKQVGAFLVSTLTVYKLRCRCLVSDMVFNLSSTRFDGSGERHYWEVEITNTAECNVMIGVCRPDAKVGETGAYTTSKGWCYFARDGKAYHSNEPKTFGTYNNPAQSGDRIGIMLNEEVRCWAVPLRPCHLAGILFPAFEFGTSH